MTTSSTSGCDSRKTATLRQLAVRATHSRGTPLGLVRRAHEPPLGLGPVRSEVGPLGNGAKGIASILPNSAG